jgi:hypothetical protein
VLNRCERIESLALCEHLFFMGTRPAKELLADQLPKLGPRLARGFSFATGAQTVVRRGLDQRRTAAGTATRLLRDAAKLNEEPMASVAGR